VVRRASHPLHRGATGLTCDLAGYVHDLERSPRSSRGNYLYYIIRLDGGRQIKVSAWAFEREESEMSSEKRYVAINRHYPRVARTGSSPEDAVDGFREEAKSSYDIYEIGPEVKEPDYGPLVAWAKERHTPATCAGTPTDVFPCTCGLTDALKAAGID